MAVHISCMWRLGPARQSCPRAVHFHCPLYFPSTSTERSKIHASDSKQNIPIPRPDLNQSIRTDFLMRPTFLKFNFVDASLFARVFTLLRSKSRIDLHRTVRQCTKFCRHFLNHCGENKIFQQTSYQCVCHYPALSL